jgi:murein L,D-transpeptidase YafK
LKRVKGFTKDGDIKLDNGWVITKDFGNLTHGYCVTSHSSQSKGVDCVFVAESSASFQAADREQFYVSVSRFKESLTIYTDDKHELLEAVRKSSKRPSAMDLAEPAEKGVTVEKAKEGLDARQQEGISQSPSLRPRLLAYRHRAYKQGMRI